MYVAWNYQRLLKRVLLTPRSMRLDPSAATIVSENFRVDQYLLVAVEHKVHSTSRSHIGM